jgi:hypothetical protein
MSNAVSPLQGAAGVDRAVGNLLLDVLESSLQLAGIPLSQGSQDALHQLRDEINGHQRDAAHQCHHGGSAAAPFGGPAATQGFHDPTQDNGRQGLLGMLMQLLQIIAPLMQLMQQQEAAHHAAHQAGHEPPALPQGTRQKLRELGNLFEGLGEGIHLADTAIAKAAGLRQPH